MKRCIAYGELVQMDDIKCNYSDVLNTAREINFKMTNFKELEELIK
jgi:hypothetical protein